MKAKLWIVMMTLVGIPAAALAAEIFRTVDEDGNVVFSDVPPPPSQESESIRVEPLNTFESADAAPATPSSEDPEVPEVASYDSLTIISPANDETVRENAGNVSIAVALNPPLRAGDQLVLYIDGQQSSARAQGNSFNLENVDRGTHTVGVRVLDGQGRVVAEAAPATFHLQRVSVRPVPAPTRRAG